MHTLPHSRTHCIYLPFISFQLPLFLLLLFFLVCHIHCHLPVTWWSYFLGTGFSFQLLVFPNLHLFFSVFALPGVLLLIPLLVLLCELSFKCPYLSCILSPYNILIQFCTLVIYNWLILSLWNKCTLQLGTSISISLSSSFFPYSFLFSIEHVTSAFTI